MKQEAIERGFEYMVQCYRNKSDFANAGGDMLFLFRWVGLSRERW